MQIMLHVCAGVCFFIYIFERRETVVVLPMKFALRLDLFSSSAPFNQSERERERREARHYQHADLPSGQMQKSVIQYFALINMHDFDTVVANFKF
jgi:hypothetical protein